MRRSVKYGLYGAVLAGVTAAATAAFAAPGTTPPKSVRLVVDGVPQTVSTSAGEVSDVLADKGYRVSAHDIVAPAVDTSIANGQTIVYKRGRLLHLNIDGKPQNVWTTAPTVNQALEALGFTQQDFVSVSRSRRLPLGATSLLLRKPKAVTVVHDHAVRHLRTTDATVGQVLRDLHLSLRKYDRLSPATPTALTQGMKVVITRVAVKRVVKHQTIDYGIVKRNDSSMYDDQSTVVRDGKEGSRKLVYSVTYVNGRFAHRKLLSRVVVSRPVTKIEHFGTKPRPAPKPAPVPAPEAAPARASSSAPVPSSSSGLNWDGVAACESGGDWSIDTGNGFYGGLQFTNSTWLAYGGGAYASQANYASRDQQIAIAEKVYQGQGAGAWPVCGANP